MTRTPRPALAALALALSAGLSAGLLGAPSATAAAPGPGAGEQPVTEPIVIAHRGASGYRPEHTLAAYRLAIRMGADYIEPDLVSTKDGVLVARHENEISGTTDVSTRPEFAARRTTKTIDGVAVTGWFTEDFTLAELKTLRAKERLPFVRPGNTAYDGRFEVPTLAEVLRLAKQKSRKGRTIGVYPETKHPTYFDSIGLSLEEPLVRTLRRFGLHKASSPVIIQSFETGNLRDLDKVTRVPLAQLMDAKGAPYDLVAAGDQRTYADLLTRKGLRWVARYADGLGANKDIVLPRDPATGATTAPSRVVKRAHREDLVVHVWTVRAENQFMATNFRRGTDPNARGRVRAEIRALLAAGVDGIFADHPDVAVQVRDRWVR